ncbi:hypothetical protein [Chamaesiphon sp.]|uniref:hypothetical protein n=1 Tax=Chamaesiphon sp. TaxID=2814140 RepID=UPI00359489F9
MERATVTAISEECSLLTASSDDNLYITSSISQLCPIGNNLRSFILAIWLGYSDEDRIATRSRQYGKYL